MARMVACGVQTRRRIHRLAGGAGAMLAVLTVLGAGVACGRADGPDLAKVALPDPVPIGPEGGGGFRLWIMTADAKHQVPITRSFYGGNAMGPAWSPDGSRIAFHNSSRAGDGGIYVVNADGTGLTNLTAGTGGATHPTWSPDGTRIAFSRDDGIHVMNADGSGQTRLSDGFDPAWSPDGTKIAFTTTPYGEPPARIGVMNADGTDPVLFPAAEGDDSQTDDVNPSWSPDGAWIVFNGGSEGELPIHIFIARADGSERRAIPVKEGPELNPAYDVNPAWSPNGKWILYSGSGGLWLVDPEGKEHRDLFYRPRDPGTPVPQDLSPVWSPDASRIAFFRYGDFHPPK